MSTEIPPDFVPDEEILQTLLSMGITRQVAELALFKTGNKNCDTVMTYLFDSDDNIGAENNLEEEYCKMVFVVNTSLKMSTGKTASQVAHACLGLYRRLETNPLIQSWEFNGEKKVVLAGCNQMQLIELKNKAEKHGVPCHLVADAGRTEVESGSNTVLALFGTELEVNEITGDLELLK